MFVTASQFSTVKPTRNGKFALRLRAETGTDAFVRQHMKEHNGAKPSREEQDKHARWQTLFVVADNADALNRLQALLTDGERKGALCRLTSPGFTWQGTHTDEETGEVRTADNLTTGIRYLNIWDNELRVFVPALAAIRE